MVTPLASGAEPTWQRLLAGEQRNPGASKEFRSFRDLPCKIARMPVGGRGRNRRAQVRPRWPCTFSLNMLSVEVDGGDGASLPPPNGKGARRRRRAWRARCRQARASDARRRSGERPTACATQTDQASVEIARTAAAIKPPIPVQPRPSHQIPGRPRRTQTNRPGYRRRAPPMAAAPRKRPRRRGR